MREKEVILNKRLKSGPKSTFVWLKKLFLYSNSKHHVMFELVLKQKKEVN